MPSPATGRRSTSKRRFPAVAEWPRVKPPTGTVPGAMSGAASAGGTSRRVSASATRREVADKTGQKTLVLKPAGKVSVKPPTKAGEPVTTYARALRFLARLADFERMRIVRYTAQNFDLARMRSLLKRVGDPQDRFRSVHVAGTKGKGSTCVMTAAMLEGNGYRVGLYSSPHLLDVRERITLNGEMIPQVEFTRLVRQLEPHVGKINPTPSYFDVLTAVAFLWFAEQKVDLAVVETGLGGRLDSTNVLRPEVTAITPISKDHTAQLGHTLTAIAGEKAGIFKQGVPAVSSPQPAEVEAVLADKAAGVGATLDVCGRTVEFSYRFEASRLLGRYNRVCFATPTTRFEHLPVPLLGDHQAVNLGVALCILDKLKARGLPIDDARSAEGLTRVRLAGRMETISHHPRVLVDCAHNAASIDAMLRAIGQNVKYDSLVVIFGCCSDKDVDGMLQRITCGADKVIFTRIDNVRTADPADLASRYVEKYGKMAQTASNFAEALGIARRAVGRDDLICVTGSFYLVAEAKRSLADRRASTWASA